MKSQIRSATGIWQGCPLALLLFMVALDALYRRMATASDIRGVQANTSKITICGYADVAALYQNDETSARNALALLQDFGEQSGLQHRDELSRYLGIQLAFTPSTVHIGDHSIRQIQARTVLAAANTNNALRRARMAQAIIIPKILFVARHCWASAGIRRQVQRRIRNFVWRYIVSEHAKTVGWMNETLAAKPPNEGGIGLPLVNVALQAMAGAYVTRNAAPVTKPEDLPQMVNPVCQPSREAAHAPQMTSMEAAGAGILARANAISRSALEMPRYCGILPERRKGGETPSPTLSRFGNDVR
ncbi:TPA: hypothetical protein N0F65_003753 [Lagenidium giganteum]|uniref:Reverse transcriptase domain-containing protein n=1 Tax=Lagenidium giganteum TaxID=4803 RepID=A0AAV2YMI3_9STRA|nr:TPA: hypothetical protein N0F65_003753 [Lagenidium giganteum]